MRQNKRKKWKTTKKWKWAQREVVCLKNSVQNPNRRRKACRKRSEFVIRIDVPSNRFYDFKAPQKSNADLFPSFQSQRWLHSVPWAVGQTCRCPDVGFGLVVKVPVIKRNHFAVVGRENILRDCLPFIHTDRLNSNRGSFHFSTELRKDTRAYSIRRVLYRTNLHVLR